MTLLERLLPFDMQFTVWHYDLAGDATETSACISEHAPGTWDPHGNLWDRTQTYLDTVELWYIDEQQATHYWWALPWVTEFISKHPCQRSQRRK